jgi:hypothetical protein
MICYERTMKNECNLRQLSCILVAIPTAIAAFYLPVTLMCLLYFRIYRETVKRRKELHLLQAQHHTKSAPSTLNSTNSNSRLQKTTSIPVTTSAMERDESVSTDSTRSHGKGVIIQHVSTNKKVIVHGKTSKHRSNHTCYCCYHRR